MRLTIVNLFIAGRIRERKRSAGILAQKPGKMNPPYAGCRFATVTGYKVRVVKDARRLPVAIGIGSISHRHLPVPDRSTDSDAFGRIDDGVGVHAVVAVEVIDGTGLAELFDAERLDPVAPHAAEPTKCRRVTIDHGDDAAVARQRRKQFFDVAEM